MTLRSVSLTGIASARPIIEPLNSKFLRNITRTGGPLYYIASISRCYKNCRDVAPKWLHLESPEANLLKLECLLSLQIQTLDAKFSIYNLISVPKLARGAWRTPRYELAFARVQPAFRGSSRNVMKISASPATLALTGSERDRTSSGEVEADKLADPAHASLSE